MMQLLIPLGLLGLIGILALILIYVIKPNYQTKQISSTYIWKLSLKYRRKRLPTSKLRNILLFLCQLLVLIAMALILAQPAIVHSNETGELDAIAILDSSASMYAGADGETRFDRAVDGAKKLSEETLRQGGNMSVILAEKTPTYLARRVTGRNQQMLWEEFDRFDYGDTVCSYGSADIGAALDLSEEVLAENPTAKIYIFTDTSYYSVPENVEIVSVAKEGEWNAAILSVSSELVDGYYTVTVEVASYGATEEINLRLDAANVDGLSASVSVPVSVTCEEGVVKTVIFSQESGAKEEDENNNVVYAELGAENRFYSYGSLHVTIEDADDFSADNDFYLYDGQKEVLKVLYASTDPNPFFTSALDTMKEMFKDRWQLDVEEVPKGRDFPTEGYDFYIYEHNAPETLPVDGAVFLSDPNRAPAGSGLRIPDPEHPRMFSRMVACNNMTPHPLTQSIIPENILISMFTQIYFDPEYTAVLSIDDIPLFLVQNDRNSKIAVMPFSVHYSNIALQPEWIILLYNLFDYFFPATVDKTAFEVNENIVLNARGPRVTYSDYEDPIEEFPATLNFSVPGTYTLTQELFYAQKDPVNVNIFVKIPRKESDIWAVEDGLEDPYKEQFTGSSYDDLLVYVAAALFALVFLEWILHSREGR